MIFNKLNLKSYSLIKSPKFYFNSNSNHFINYREKKNERFKRQINLDNFDNYNCEIKITSPNSLEALKSLGIDQKNLYIISKEDFFKKFVDQNVVSSPNTVENEQIEKKYIEYKNDKEEILKKLKEKRNEIIKEKKIHSLGYFNDVK